MKIRNKVVLLSQGSRNKRHFFSGPATKSGWGHLATKKKFFLKLKKNSGKNVVPTKLEGGGGGAGKTTKKNFYCGFP